MVKSVQISNKRLAQIIDMQLASISFDSTQSEIIYNRISEEEGFINIRESEEVKFVEED